MAEKTDRRIRKTKSQLRAGLAKLMQQKSIKEITVKELVNEVDINRSTFYLHYTDIYHMLDTIENELLEEIMCAINAHPIGISTNTFSFIGDIFTILTENMDICCSLMGPNGDNTFIFRIEEIIDENIMKALSQYSAVSGEDLKYTYAFCFTGCVGVIKTWLQEAHQESPEHMAKLTYNMVAHALESFSLGQTAK